MKRNLITLFLCSFSSIMGMHAQDSLPYGYPASDRTKTLINTDWRFKLGEADSPYYRAALDDASWEEVTIPHTLQLTDINLDGCQDDPSQPTFHRTVGWYRKDLYVPKGNQKVYLEFEGVHQVTTLWVNGNQVGMHRVGGYTPFNFDITDYVRKGSDNQITILADNRVNQLAPPDPDLKDYVMFGGIYRDLYLVEKNPIHITSNLESARSGVTITTPSVDVVNGNATIHIQTEVRNESRRTQQMKLVQRVTDTQGKVVLKLSESFGLGPGELYHASQTGGVDRDVKFWSLEHPYLYRVNTTLYNDQGKAVDVVDNRLGLRKIAYDPETGLQLNGKPIKLVGFNRHQNYGFIGDAAPNSLHYRDMKQFKELGLNCVRTAHYPQDDELIKACDELGILVYEEAPTWHGIAKEEEWYTHLHQAAQAMIRNHKNSPSVFAWGAGVNHRGVVAEMQFLAKEEDPTRLTGSQNSRWTGWMTSGWSDIYANMNYAASIWEREEPQLAMEGNGGPEALAPYFREPMRVGMISWSSAAYYTFSPDVPEPGNRTHHSGFWNVFRYPRKPELMWYPSQMKVKPFIHIPSVWDEDLKMLTIYSNATEIEIRVNGKSQGRFLPSRAQKYHGLTHAPFEIKDFVYEEGELLVIGYREGEVMAQERVFTPTKPTALRLLAHQYDVPLKADGNDLVIVHAEVVDKHGMCLRDYQGEVRFKVLSGDASLIGGEQVGYNPAQVRTGAASAMVRAGKTPSTITLEASAPNLSSAIITLKSEPYTTDMIAHQAYPIYDSQSLWVDMGSQEQLNQFGWTPWESDQKQEAKAYLLPRELTNYAAGTLPVASQRSLLVEQGTPGAYAVSVKAVSPQAQLQWLGGMSTIGKDNNVFGDGVGCEDEQGMTLTLSQLPKGKYEIRTYHHSPRGFKLVPKVKVQPAKYMSAWLNGVCVEQDMVVTSGAKMQYEEPTIMTTSFRVEKETDIHELTFKPQGDNPAVWLNGFELIRHL